jgi:hypothetical protein
VRWHVRTGTGYEYLPSCHDVNPENGTTRKRNKTGPSAEPASDIDRIGWAVIQVQFLPHSGAEYAGLYAMPKAIYKAGETGRGFITIMLSPVNCRQEPKFGVRQTVWMMLLTFGTVAVMRLLLAH